MWRLAAPRDDATIVELCLALYAEDPSPRSPAAAQVQATLAALRESPVRGRAVVLELGGEVAGYALLVSFWSNELGGELAIVDEIYVRAAHRSRGFATRLVEALERGELWPGRPVALGLEVTPRNLRARRLYERLGFVAVTNMGLRRLL